MADGSDRQMTLAENLQPTLLLNLVSVGLIALGFALPWLLASGRHVRYRRS
jgi:hypothetical protein